jgi:hypothetical protein
MEQAGAVLTWGGGGGVADAAVLIQGILFDLHQYLYRRRGGKRGGGGDRFSGIIEVFTSGSLSQRLACIFVCMCVYACMHERERERVCVYANVCVCVC